MRTGQRLPSAKEDDRRRTTEAEPPPSPTPRSRWFDASLWHDLLWGLTSGGLALGAIIAVQRLWRAQLNVPLSPIGDVTLSLMTVRTMQTEGWVGSTPDLGAPLGQDLAAWPATVGDTWHLVALKLLSLVLSPAAAVNVYYVLGFPLAAVVAYGCLRALRVSPPLSCALGVAYAVLPYHLIRGEGHLFLSAYYAVPIACVLAVAVYRDRLAIVASRRVTRLGWEALAGAALLAGTGLYYAVFTVAVVGSAAILGALAARRLRPIVSAAVISIVIVIGLGLAAIPNLAYLLGSGGRSAAQGRSYGATEFYGLKIVNLLLPLTTHRLSLLGKLRARTSDSPIPGEGSETLGIIGAVGLVVIVLAVLVPLVGRRSAVAERLRPLGAVALVAILFGTVAGLNSLLAVLGFAEMRAWNRISVLIAFPALAGIGVLLDAVAARFLHRAPSRQRLGLAATAAALTLVAVFDQTSDAYVPNYPVLAQAWVQDDAYFLQVQDRIGARGNVFALPVAPFPENPPIVDMVDYSHLRGYLHSDLRWSYGGVKGGDVEWQQIAMRDGVAEALPLLVAAGFDAIYVNRLGYADRGAGVEAEIRAVTDAVDPLVSADGLLATYDIRAYAQRLRAEDSLEPAERVLFPVRLSFVSGVYPAEEADGERWQWAGSTAGGVLENPTDEDAKIRLHGVIRVADPSATVTVTVGGDETVFTARDGAVNLDLRTSVSPGATEVDISTGSGRTVPAASDPRLLYQQLVGLGVERLD